MPPLAPCPLSSIARPVPLPGSAVARAGRSRPGWGRGRAWRVQRVQRVQPVGMGFYSRAADVAMSSECAIGQWGISCECPRAGPGQTVVENKLWNVKERLAGPCTGTHGAQRHCLDREAFRRAVLLAAQKVRCVAASPDLAGLPAGRRQSDARAARANYRQATRCVASPRGRGLCACDRLLPPGPVRSTEPLRRNVRSAVKKFLLFSKTPSSISKTL